MYGNERKHIEIFKSGNKTIVKNLIELGVDINEEYRKGWTPLLYACQKGHIKIVKYLVENGADMNKEIYDDNNPLFECLLLWTY